MGAEYINHLRQRPGFQDHLRGRLAVLMVLGGLGVSACESNEPSKPSNPETVHPPGGTPPETSVEEMDSIQRVMKLREGLKDWGDFKLFSDEVKRARGLRANDEDTVDEIVPSQLSFARPPRLIGVSPALLLLVEYSFCRPSPLKYWSDVRISTECGVSQVNTQVARVQRTVRAPDVIHGKVSQVHL